MVNTYEMLYGDFLDLEEEFDLFSLTINGVHVWERIRFKTFEEIVQKRGLWGPAIPDIEKNFNNVSKGALMWAANLVRRNPFLSSKHDYLFYGMGRRKRLDDGFWWDIYCDPIYESLELDYLHIEPPYLNKHNTPIKTDTYRYSDLIEYTSTIVRELGLINSELGNAEQQRCQQIAEAIKNRFSVDVDIESKVEFRLSLRRSLKPLYLRLLRRVDPEVVFIVPSVLRHVLIESCQEEKIPVVELQHGALSEYEYGFPSNRNKRTFPDYFFSWGEYWNDTVELPIPEDQIRSVGYPYFEQRQDQIDKEVTSEEILFISQGNIGEALSKIAVEVSQQSEIDASKIVYKLHPTEYDEWQSKYPWLVDADLQVIASNQPSLYKLFSRAESQVGVYSTAIYEGLGFGLSTYVIDLPGANLLSDLYKQGHAELVTSAQELIPALSQGRAPDVDVSQFFKPNSIQNFSQEVERIQRE